MTVVLRVKSIKSNLLPSSRMYYYQDVVEVKVTVVEEDYEEISVVII